LEVRSIIVAFIAVSHSREKDSRQMAVGSKCGTTNYRTPEEEKILASFENLPSTGSGW